MITGVIAADNTDRNVAAKLAELAAACPEPKLQASVMREAAAAIREMVIEERLRAARIAASQGMPQ